MVTLGQHPTAAAEHAIVCLEGREGAVATIDGFRHDRAPGRRAAPGCHLR